MAAKAFLCTAMPSCPEAGQRAKLNRNCHSAQASLRSLLLEESCIIKKCSSDLLEVENGVSTIGTAQTKNVSIGSVRLDAEDAKCYAVSEAIGTLMSHAIVNVYVTEKAALDQAE